MRSVGLLRDAWQIVVSVLRCCMLWLLPLPPNSFATLYNYTAMPRLGGANFRQFANFRQAIRQAIRQLLGRQLE